MEYEPKSSPNNINSFMETVLYKDYLNEIDLRLEESIELVLQPEATLNLTGLTGDIIKGRIKNLREMKTVFEDILNISLELINNKDEDKEEEPNDS